MQAFRNKKLSVMQNPSDETSDNILFKSEVDPIKDEELEDNIIAILSNRKSMKA